MPDFFSKNRYLLGYLFFFSVTTVRFFWEAHFSDFVDSENLFFHHHYWFLFVFLLFLLSFKHILKLEPDKMIWTAFLSPVIFIPIIYNILFRGGGPMRLNYLSAINFGQYVRDVFTFLLFSDINKPVSVELLLITISIFTFGYVFTRNIKRSFLCAVLCYLSLMILAGTSIIAPKKPEFALVVVGSSLKLQNFFSFLYFNAATITATILFFNPLKDFLSDKRTRIFLTIFFIVTFTAIQFLNHDFSLTDRLFLISHSFLISLFVTVLLFLKRNLQVKLLLGVHIAVSSKILFSAFNFL
jgi:hypothetical protein